MDTDSGSTIWKAQGAQKRDAVRQMFAQIAPQYDLLNSLISLRLHHRWRASAVRQLALNEGDSTLDVCCGTGDFMFPLRRAVGERGRVVGTDFCLPMLQHARAKGVPGALSLGDACTLPFAAGSFHGLSVGWGIRNVADIDAAHREIVRVLRPGGRFVSIDTARPGNPLVRAVSEFVFNTLVPALGRLFGRAEAYRYLPESTRRFWSREQLAASMERAGLVDVGHRDLMLGNVCIHWGRKP